MKYTKLPVSIPEQITKLKNRGLCFLDEKKAADYLSNISYYRLRAYTFPFQDNENRNHPFIQKVSFEEIIELYCFDRRLPPIALPRKTLHQFIDNKRIHNNKNYSYICCILYLLNIISPEHSFKNNLLNLMKTCPMMQEKEMGFPKNWQKEKLWQ